MSWEKNDEAWGKKDKKLLNYHLLLLHNSLRTTSLDVLEKERRARDGLESVLNVIYHFHCSIWRMFSFEAFKWTLSLRLNLRSGSEMLSGLDKVPRHSPDASLQQLWKKWSLLWFCVFFRSKASYNSRYNFILAFVNEYLEDLFLLLQMLHNISETNKS